MSDEISKNRSPRSPGIALEDALNLTRKLFDQIRSATVVPETAVKALGYNGMNGTAMTTLATIGQYGLVDRTKGNVTITPLAIKILHPKSVEQQEQGIQEAALTPVVFQELNQDMHDCAEAVITGHLIQNGFTPDRAKLVASIYVANKVFAKLSEKSNVEHPHEETMRKGGETAKQSIATQYYEDLQRLPQSGTHPTIEAKKVLAQYSIPLGGNDATITFTGETLAPDDFDALAEYVLLFKKQFERKLASSVKAPEKVVLHEVSADE